MEEGLHCRDMRLVRRCSESCIQQDDISLRLGPRWPNMQNERRLCNQAIMDLEGTQIQRDRQRVLHLPLDRNRTFTLIKLSR